jgi:hypothetical protein
MQVCRDIFGIWGTNPTEASQVLAEELEEKPDTVYRWNLRRRIPERKWDGVIRSASSRGVDLTPDELFRFNRSAPPPVKPAKRGRPKKTGNVRPLRAVQ